ncbi:YciI family protein [Aliagarivorans marinus]|uniref:YciI family protein n=1 Tax=Aliagarivorans marinus TaxID=561965 RepID=UPI000413DBC7|nr:YciI family protein [Aliagarivorans marinus]
MFVISLDYIVDLERVEPLIDEHLAFLDRYYSQGVFVASGRKEPRTGGVILANKVSRAELEALIKEDPFYREKVADYQITEFLATKVGEGFEALAS